MDMASMFVSLIGGLNAKAEHERYADLLRGQKLNMPSGITDAEGIYKSNAGTGLPGMENYINDIQSLIPDTANTAKQVVDNPSQLLQAIMDSQENASGQIRKLGIADADAKLQNEVAYANFLSGVKAPVEMGINEFDIQKTLGAKREDMIGWQEWMKGLGQFASNMDQGIAMLGSQGGGSGGGGFNFMDMMSTNNSGSGFKNPFAGID